MGKRVHGDLLTYPTDGFWAIAEVATKYVLSEDVIRPVGSAMGRSYKPFKEDSLPTALARVSTGGVSPVEFASEYGELGFFSLLRNSSASRFTFPHTQAVEFKPLKEAYTTWRNALTKAQKAYPKGDPIEWVLAHARTVALCLEFIGLLGEGDEYAIRDIAEGATGPHAQRGQIVTPPSGEWRRSLQRGATPSAVLRPYLSHIITENISGVRRHLVVDPFATRTDSAFLCCATIEAVYWQIADGMENKRVRRCEECGRFFLTGDVRRRYCPASGGSTRSRCSSRLNTQKHRDRLVNKGKGD